MLEIPCSIFDTICSPVIKQNNSDSLGQLYLKISSCLFITVCRVYIDDNAKYFGNFLRHGCISKFRIVKVCTPMIKPNTSEENFLTETEFSNSC